MPPLSSNITRHAPTAMGRRWSFPIGTIAGTVIRIHYTFLILFAWIGVAGWAASGPTAALHTLTFFALLFLCVVLHEFGHIFAARRFGVRTPEVVLLPIGGVSRMERIPEEPQAEFVIAIAGPAVTLVIALVLILALGGLPAPEAVAQDFTLHGLIVQLAFANLVLFVFNLIPAFPLDGGRVLRAGLAATLGHTRGTRVAAQIGQAAAFLLGLAGLFGGNMILVLVAVFIYLAAGSENGIAQLHGITSGKPASASMISSFVSLQANDPVREAANALIHTEQREFPVVDDQGRLEGLLTRDGIVQALVTKGPESPIADVMRRDIAAVSRWTLMDDIVSLLTEGAPAVGVVDDHGRCLGYITWENLMEELMISRALDQRRARTSAAR
ncbi:site-2 protease family protein [Novosphingobium mangrovi (ex Huang et al. 2023)]|uniref:Zinc metalloprotease n=1 Tax=Novosphingobium mangrovi (ex Huang et al. 2023) TaxID=2976432 RepID=A0ABT2I0K2_9SPHN|nr:site-2 protease family protein [Novosphingobium mangrovi (ex Huang et al. 2023)]MCT2398325.1 site-2 protease family protein [Novosphingobium mangrovi (ex Huang et al. 2023)]